jgi:ABC-type bacteriocin/lantibiotic exporter with double-glycine peptidase domain
MSQFSFYRLIKPYRYLMFGTIIALCCFSALGLTLPWMLKIAIDKVIPNADYTLFALLCCGMFLLFSARAVCFFIASYLTPYK